MLREFAFVAALAVPAVAAAQQPCTPNARSVVDELYRTVLERPANRDLDVMARRLAGGETSVRDIVRQLAVSQEYTQRFGSNGSSDAQRRAAVTAFYRHLLGREPDPAGLQAHMEGLRAEGANAVVDAFLSSEEYRTQFGDNRVPGTQVRYCGAGAGLNTSNRAGYSQFRNMDSNRDGHIARDEWRGTTQAFRTSDRNRDGVLTADEFRASANNGAVGTGGTIDNEAAARFDALDGNRDGRIQRREWAGTAAEFDRIDSDRNNLLSRTEVSAVAPPATTTDNFRTLDVNRDGRLSIEEWNWNRRSFDQQDANGDGVITSREFQGAPGQSQAVPRDRNGF